MSIALITGGCSGMGFEYASILAGKGYDLLLVSNEEGRLGAAKKKLREIYSVSIITLCLDLSMTNAAHKIYQYCEENNFVVDILINNAGMFFFCEVAKTDPGKVSAMLNLHMHTPTLLCRFFGDKMKERRSGYILNMSSISAYMPYPGISLYGATKRYLKNFSRAFRSEMLDYNVSVTCVLPGAVATNLFDRNVIDYKKAIRYGLMMHADKVAGMALRAMFRKKASVVPGLINKIIVPLVCITPVFIILYIKRHTRLLPADEL